MNFANVFGLGGHDLVLPMHFTASRDWTAPCPGRLVVYMMGAGGGGPGGVHSSQMSSVSASTGGTAGAWGANVFDLDAGDVVQIEIGAGGAGGAVFYSGDIAKSHGKDGGPSILRVNGTERMRTPGGIGGKLNQNTPNGPTAEPTGILIGCRGFATRPDRYKQPSGGTVALNSVDVNPNDGIGNAENSHGLIDLRAWGIVNSTFAEQHTPQPVVDGWTRAGFGNGGVYIGFSGKNRRVGLGGGGCCNQSGTTYGKGGDGYAYAQFIAEA